jgi:omega-amidase
MRKKVVLYQQKPGGGIPDDDFNLMQDENPDFLCLPEYFFVPGDVNTQIETADQTAENREWLAEVSRELDCVIIGGSTVERDDDRLYNTCFIHSKGEEIGFYRKLNPFGRETSLGISAGEGLQVFEVQNVRVGVLICADVLIPDVFKEMRAFRPQIIFCPTTSPFRDDDTVEAKKERDLKIFVSGARDSGAYVVKTCAAGSLMNRKLQGRSLVAAPWGVIRRADFAEEDKKQILTAALNLRMLKNWKGDVSDTPSADWEFDLEREDRYPQ